MACPEVTTNHQGRGEGRDSNPHQTLRSPGFQHREAIVKRYTFAGLADTWLSPV